MGGNSLSGGEELSKAWRGLGRRECSSFHRRKTTGSPKLDGSSNFGQEPLGKLLEAHGSRPFFSGHLRDRVWEEVACSGLRFREFARRRGLCSNHFRGVGGIAPPAGRLHVLLRLPRRFRAHRGGTPRYRHAGRVCLCLEPIVQHCGTKQKARGLKPGALAYAA